ncbi:MAG: N-acetylmuramoyl-L-alanine amidase, partial [Bacteroidales bacterium]
LTKEPRSADYGPALTNLTPCNYTPGRTHSIDTWVHHYIGTGTYAGAISWFHNCTTPANASAHFVIRSSDGEITQCVLVADKAWHCGVTDPSGVYNNARSIGVEHEATAANPALWNSTPMLQASATMVCYFCNLYNIPATFHTSPGICGHNEMPGTATSCPGALPWTTWINLFNQCNGTTPNNPANLLAAQSACPVNEVTFSWTNSDSGWHIDVSTSSGFTSYWWKWVSNLTTYTGPAGFVDHVDGVTPLTFQDGVTYYWRITNSNGNFNGPTFTMHVCDVTSPTTSISVTGNWQTQDFTANFTDTDNPGGSGLEKSFYQVLDYNGTEWHANAQNGFFADNFDSYNSSVWSVPVSSGTWTVSGGNLIQSDTSVNNSNIYASLNQNLSNRYMYQFYAKIDPATYSASQHRFGFHFFSDNGALTNRGNSYFIFFRQETSKLEFYKVENDTFILEKVVDNITTTLGQWYDYKVIFDRITGKIDVYRDDVFLSSWTDTNVLTNQGNYISFRTGHCKAYINELKVYRSRNASVAVTVGAATTNDIRYQNPDPSTSAAKIKSIVNDTAGNLSSIDYYNLNIDWTQPTCVTVNDGTGSDMDTTTSTDTLSANWATSSDPNSGIAKYRYAIGTTAGDTDVVNWTDNALLNSVTKTGLPLNPGQTYYFSVKAENGAGLICISSSDGITVNSLTTAGFTMNPTSVCEGESIQFTNTSVNATSYQWTFTGGSPSTSMLANLLVTYNTAGNFNVQLIATGSVTSDTLTRQITVNASPVAAFSTPDTNLAVGSALALFTNSSAGATSYFWDFGDGNTSTDVSPWNIYSAAGDYTVTLIAYSTLCGNDTLILTNYIHVGVTGIDENENGINVSIQPNPFNGSTMLYFSLKTEQKIRITLADMHGREILISEEAYKAGKHSIDINSDELNLSKGVYTLKLSTKNNSVSAKLISVCP